MAAKETHFFARGNTAAGLYTLYDSVLSGLQTVFVLEGCPGSGSARILQELADRWSDRNWNLQLIHQPLDHRCLEGIIVNDLRIGIVDGNAWSAAPVLEGTEIKLVDIENALDETLIHPYAEDIAELEQQIGLFYREAYNTFLKTLRIHDEWEKFYIDSLDRAKADQIVEDWIDEYLITSPESKQTGTFVRRFLGAATWQGATDFVPNLTENMKTRIFVKGRPGSGKSTMFKKIAAAAEKRGIDTEIYHCGFDPNSLDMLIFPELSLAIFDSTAPHEYFPSREGDEILDVYELAIAPGTDEKYADRIPEIKARYSSSMKESIALLAKAKEAQDQLIKWYDQALDDSILGQKTEALIQEIDELANIHAR